MEEDDEIFPIVIDCGSFQCKIGFAGDDAPRTVFPCIVGIPHQPKIMVGIHKTEYIGDDAQVHRGVLKICYPIQRGIVVNWDYLERIWHHSFYNELKVNPAEHPVMLTEPVLNPKANRERMFQLLFEVFEVSEAFVYAQPLLSLFSSGRACGLILDCGDGVSQTIPCYEGHVISHAIMRMDVGGSDLTDWLKRLLCQSGFSAATTAEREIVRTIKENVCYVALDFAEELSAFECFDKEVVFELPDGVMVTIGNEQFRCPEALFKPELIGKECLGIHELVHESILKCAIDLRKMFYTNVILAGGSTLFAGLPERLSLELKHLFPLNALVKVVAAPERKYSVWIGGSMVASLATMEGNWIKKEDVQEFGMEFVHDKCIL